MQKIISKLSKSTITVVVLLVVYVMHFFLLEEVLISKIQSNTYATHGKHDAGSVESRALFKYEGSRQFIHIHEAPVVAVVSNDIVAPEIITAPAIHAKYVFVLPDKSYKRFSMNSVFLI